MIERPRPPGKAIIQFQDVSGTWRNVTTVINNDQIILRNIDSVAKQMGNRVVRAVDERGSILQMGGAFSRNPNKA